MPHMDFHQRAVAYEFDDIAPDEELPDYDQQAAPSYESADYELPLLSFHLRQVHRKLQMLVPSAHCPTAASYKIVSNTGIRLFSKKPDMEILCAASSESRQEQSAALLWFDNDGPLPWRPRAHFSIATPTRSDQYHMESRNFSDWTFAIGPITYAWRLHGKPECLVLAEKNSNIVIARFTYSRHGTTATNGAEVGELIVYRDGLSADHDGIPKIISGLLIAIVHFKRMGRHYWNDEALRATSLTRMDVASRTSSFATSHSYL